MSRMPGAIWRPLASNYASMPRIKAWDIFCAHTMVGSLDGTDGYFRTGNGAGYTGTESHFGVGHDGTIYQWQDTGFQADANYHGGWHVISSENADIGTGFPKWNTADGGAVPAFTAAQIEANAEIAAWLHREHGIPVDLIPDSKVGRRGIGWHRLGVPARSGDTVSQSGGELWSTAAGKVCPGDRRIAQMSAISARAKQLLAAPTTPAPSEEDDTVKYLAFRNTATGEVRLAAPGQWFHVSSPGYLTLVKARGLCDEPQDVPDNEFGFFRGLFLQPEANDSTAVDVDALAAKLIPAMQSTTGASREDLEATFRDVLGSLNDAAA